MTRDFQIGRHTVRLVTTSTDYGSGMFRPGIRLFLKGPNGSPAGIGPKAWPLHWRIRRFRDNHAWAKTGWHRRNHGHYGWSSDIYIPVPHLKWHQAYRLRRFGGLRVYGALYPIYKRLGR